MGKIHLNLGAKISAAPDRTFPDAFGEMDANQPDMVRLISMAIITLLFRVYQLRMILVSGAAPPTFSLPGSTPAVI